MVNHSIKVYARLKREENYGEKGTYEIVQRKAKFDDIIFYNQTIQGNAPYSFRFHKVFDECCNQGDVFDTIAKPVINRNYRRIIKMYNMYRVYAILRRDLGENETLTHNYFSSVLQGFNGTIFAYGQTGSGKTYTITGSPKNYNDRGIIPRSIQYIFAENEKLSVKPTIYISYMEIYNEIGYDLLSPRQHNTARSLEDLPRIALLEDGKGEAHIRNLSVLPVTTEQEAMRLLFLGDTNRTIAETPMNEYSSRSHCIFTIYITYRNEPTNVIRFSKLHLVDLAGSERVSKSLTTGTALNEAKHINLSLHYLQQVILALSESKRSHIPYRNSMMTYLLKDSLCGNCLTAMLAALSISKYNVQETLSTCRFAQRVSLISTEPVINEICDPHQEIVFLKNKIEELRKQISVLTGCTAGTNLSKDEEEKCKTEVDKYLEAESSKEDLKVKSDLRHIHYCFKLLKHKINSQNAESQEYKLEYDKSQKELSILKETVDKKEAEITTLRTIIDNIPENPVNPNKSLSKTNNFETPESITIQTSNDVVRTRYQDANTTVPLDAGFPNVSQEEKPLFDQFMMIPENSKDLDYYRKSLEKKWTMAKIYADTIEQCQKNIIYVRQKLQICSDTSLKNQLLLELEEQQNIYRKSLADLKTVKNETDHLQSGLRQAEIKTMQKFRLWLENQKTSENGNVLNEICWSGSSSKSNGGNKDNTTGCCTKKCNCRNRMNKGSGLSCCTTSLYRYPDDFCPDCKRANFRLAQHHTKSHSKKFDRCGCSRNFLIEPNPRVPQTDPFLFHPAHSEMGPTNCDCLKMPSMFGAQEERISFQEEQLPPFQSQSCQSIGPNLLVSNRSSNFLDNINILIETIDKNENRQEKENQRSQQTADRNDHTKVCCQLFCCDSLTRGSTFPDKNKPKYITGCVYGAIRDVQPCYEIGERSVAPSTESLDCEHSTEDDQELCDAYYSANSCEDINLGGASLIFNTESEEVAVRKDDVQCNACQVQTQEALGAENRVDVAAEVKTNSGIQNSLFKQSDSAEFREFMKTVPLTGELDIDEEIYNFYRKKFCA